MFFIEGIFQELTTIYKINKQLVFLFTNQSSNFGFWQIIQAGQKKSLKNYDNFDFKKKTNLKNLLREILNKGCGDRS